MYLPYVGMGGPAWAGCSGLLELFTTTDELTDFCIYNTLSPLCGEAHPKNRT
jgi:hypothetical protein